LGGGAVAVSPDAFMRITAIRDVVAPIKSAIRNAYIDYSQMTASVVAIAADGGPGGKPVVGFGFNSNGRYGARGLLQDRFIPRLLDAEPRSTRPRPIVPGNRRLDRAWLPAAGRS